MKPHKIYKYKSNPKNNPLAPEWEYELYEFFLEHSF